MRRASFKNPVSPTVQSESQLPPWGSTASTISRGNQETSVTWTSSLSLNSITALANQEADHWSNFVFPELKAF